MLSSLVLCSALAAALTSVDVSAMVGTGVGVSPNSSTIYGVPWLSLHADAVFDNTWYVGGGLVGFTFIDPRFAFEEDPLSRGVFDGTARVGIVLLQMPATQLRGDFGVLFGLHENAPDDAPPGIYLYPSLGAVSGVRAEWMIADDAYLHLGAAATVILAPFGIVEFVPKATIGAGWRF